MIDTNNNELKIKIEDRIFSLNLSNLDNCCRDSLVQTFYNKEYLLEELLVEFVKLLCERGAARSELMTAKTELLKILKSLES